MPNIDELTVQFKGKGVGTVANNIRKIADAVEVLASKSQGIDSAKFSSLASSIELLKKSVPTSNQVTNLKELAVAIAALNTAAGSGDITTFANGINTVSTALNGLKGTPKKQIDNITSSLQQAGQQAQKTASQMNGVSPKSKGQGKQSTPNPKTPSIDVNAFVKQFEEVNKHLTKASDLASKFGKKLLSTKTVVPTKAMKSLQEQTEKARKAYEELREKMIKTAQEAKNFNPSSKSWVNQQKELDGLRNKYNGLIQKQKELSLEGSGFKLNPTITGALNAFATGFSKVTAIVKTGFISAIKKASSVVGSFVKNLFRLVTATKAFSKIGESVRGLTRKLSSEVLRLSKMLKLMVTRMALRAVIKEVGNGFKSLALHSEAFNQSMSALINGSKKLGYSFAGMVEPLINALAPALIYIINLITRVINALNQLFTALGGGTVWHRAKDFTDSWADSIKEANGKAKELKKTVLGFDELNQLQDNKNSGSGADITDMFEDVKIDPKWMDFAKWLKDMWAKGDFYDLGKLWGEKLRDALESIPWGKIYSTANKLGRSLASLINGFVEVERLGYDIGMSIAKSLNTVFEFVNGFVHKLHWDSVGKFIADVFNGFFEKINWTLIKDTVVTGMAGIAQAIQTFIETFHWDNISHFIINAVDTVVKGIKAFVEGIKWKDLGTKLGGQLMKTVRGIKWREVGEALGEIFQAAIDFLAGFIDQLKVEDVVKAVSDLIAGFFDKVDTEEAGRNIGKIIQFLIAFIKEFWNQNGETIKTEVGNFFKGIWDEVDKEDIAKIGGGILGAALLSGTLNAVAFLAKRAVGKLITDAIFGSGGAAAAGAAAGGEVVKGVSAGISSSVAGGGLATALAGLKAAILPVAATVAIGYGIAIPASKKLEEILSETQTKVDDLKSHMDTTIPSYDEMSRAARESSRNQKEYAEKMQDMYNSILQANPELYTLARTLNDNKISIKNNADTLVQINDGLKLFRENGGDANKTLESLEEMYGKVNGRTEFFFKTLGRGNERATEVKKAMDDYNASLKETETNSERTTHIYKNHTEVVAEMKKAQEETTKVYKTHLDVIKENTSQTESIKKAVGDTAKAMPELDKALKDSQKAMSDTSGEAKKTGEEIVNGIKEPIINAKFDKESKGFFQTVVDNIKNAFGIASPAKNMYPIGNDILFGINEGFKEKFDDFKGVMQDFYDNHVKTWFDKDKWSFDGVGEGLKSTFESAKKKIGEVWNSIADGVNGEHEIGSSKIKINLPKFKYAKGGFPEDGFFFANHNELVGQFSNGKTAVANNEQIVAGIERGVYSAVSAAMANNSGGSSYISNEILVDGEVIARTITKAQEKQNRRYAPAQG